jgi:prephenate dehydratase
MADDAVDRQQRVRPTVGFQGAHGAYSEQAALALWDGDVEVAPLASFDEVFAEVEAGHLERGIVPIENSLAGSIHRNYDLLLRHNLYIIAEHNLRVSHCLIAHPGVALEEIREVYSHPQALAQCEESLHRLGKFQAIAASDTAGSVKLIKEQGLRHAAAIAGEAAAAYYGMAILRRDLEDERANYTRFLALGREQAEAHGECKTSLAFAGKNEPGLLFRCLAAFALRNIDLCKIESRPLRGVPWEYVFYLDFAGSLSEARCAHAVEQLREMSSFVRVFGSYPRGRAAALTTE